MACESLDCFPENSQMNEEPLFRFVTQTSDIHPVWMESLRLPGTFRGVSRLSDVARPV